MENPSTPLPPTGGVQPCTRQVAYKWRLTCGSWLNEVAGEVSTWLANAEKNTKWSYQVLKKTHTQICCYLTLVVFQSYRNWGEGCWKIGMFLGVQLYLFTRRFKAQGLAGGFSPTPFEQNARQIGNENRTFQSVAPVNFPFREIQVCACRHAPEHVEVSNAPPDSA